MLSCGYLRGGPVCEACGTPTQWSLVNGEQVRVHFVEHQADAMGVRHIFAPHAADFCRHVRLSALLALRSRGLLADAPGSDLR